MSSCFSIGFNFYLGFTNFGFAFFIGATVKDSIFFDFEYAVLGVKVCEWIF